MSEIKDSYVMPIGKYREYKLGDVPAKYLLYMIEQDYFQEKCPEVCSYIKANMARLEKEAKEGSE